MKRFLGLIGLLLITITVFGNDSTEVCQRLSVIERQIPLPYHHVLDDKIKVFSSKPQPVGLATYQGLIAEEIQRMGLPEELVFLPLALSGMEADYSANERAGLWAMPVLVALYYGLTIDEAHDERYSAEASTRAALTYLYDLHQNLDDWWLTLLAYTNSPSAIKGIQTCHPDETLGPWDFVKNQWLPNTDIVGDFIAYDYVYFDANLSPTPIPDNYAYCVFEEPIALSLLSAKTGVSEHTIKHLNPIFTAETFVPFKNYRIKLPKEAEQRFEDNKAQLYEETSQASQKVKQEKEIKAKEKQKEKEDANNKNYITYTVKSGDTLSKIASQYHVSVSDLKKWNNLTSDFIRDQQKLKIYQ